MKLDAGCKGNNAETLYGKRTVLFRGGASNFPGHFFGDAPRAILRGVDACGYLVLGGRFRKQRVIGHLKRQLPFEVVGLKKTRHNFICLKNWKAEAPPVSPRPARMPSTDGKSYVHATVCQCDSPLIWNVL
jgi:hypothetical protein